MRAILTEEKIADRPTAAVGEPALGQVMRPVMQHVTALAETLQIGEPVVRGIVVQMRRGQHDAGQADMGGVDQVGPACGSAAVKQRASIRSLSASV